MSYEIYNADCMKILPTINDKSIDCIITDLPYGIVSSFGEERAKYSGQLRKLDKGNADIETFELNQFLKQISRVSNGSIFLFCGYQQLSEIFTYFYCHKDFMVRVAYWHKTNPSPANGQHMYLNAVEPMVFAKRRKTKFNAHCCHNWFDFDDLDLAYFNNQKEVYETPTKHSKIHPTEKPVILLQQMILDTTEEFDIVADFCAGSFSTGDAALELGRYFIGVEIEEEWFNVGVNRLSKYKSE